MKRSTAILLAFGLALLMTINGADFFFHRAYAEFWDTAANSLSVSRAKHFTEMYGNYSHWGFHHPGPAFFYVDAFGEWLFHDLLHLAPAPYNGQVLINLFLMMGFLLTALRVFTLWMPREQRGGFLFLALGIGVLHFGAVSGGLPSYDILHGSSVFLSTWPPHVLVLPFLCLVTVGSSVAAGRGRDLLLLALVDGFLIHGHVAQPLFVLPLSFLAYAGLLGICNQREQIYAGPRPMWRRVTAWSGAAWRAFPRTHLAALAVAVFFALPIFFDLFRGTESNLMAIRRHMHAHGGEHKSLLRSLLYFLQFGAYSPYKHDAEEFGRYDAAGIRAYLRGHAPVYSAWLGAVALAFWAIISEGWKIVNGPVHVDVRTTDAPSTADRDRFLAWAGVFLVAAFALTLYWGTIQDGPLYYWNAWFDFAIYYFAALIAAAIISGWSWPVPAPRGGEWMKRPQPRALAAVMVLAALGFAQAARLRVSDAAPDMNRAMQASVSRVLAATAPGGGPRPVAAFSIFLLSWPAVINLGLQLERSGGTFAVPNHWEFLFGKSRTWDALSVQQQRAARSWRFDNQPARSDYWLCSPKLMVAENVKWTGELGETDRQSVPAGSFELLNGVRMDAAIPPLNPTNSTGGAAEISFTTGGNHADFIVGGWSGGEGFATWTESHRAMLRFRPVPVVADAVDMTLEALPFFEPEHGILLQRLRVRFDGEPLGSEQRFDAQGVTQRTFTIPAAIWNRAAAHPDAGAAMEFELPDAASPAAVGLVDRYGDHRLLGLGFRALRFRAVSHVAVPGR